MKQKPILFNTENVRAILAGRKTVTRRVVKPQPEGRPVPMTKDSCWPGYFAIHGTEKVVRLPYQPGDILWVRETWSISDGAYLYRAFPGVGMEPEKQDAAMREMGLKWRPSIFMPREAARIFLRVTDVRVERLQDMRLKDFEKEGVQLNFIENGDLVMGPIRARERFSGVWDSTIKTKYRPTYGWEANPWVWVIEFERISKEEATHEK